MGLFYNFQKEGKGVPKDQKTPRLILFFQVYFRKFWNLLLLNLLYVLFCIPVVTIGPATAGMTKILRNYAREEHAFLWGDFIETFKKNFKQAFIYSLIDFLVTGFLVLDFLSIYSLQNKVMLIICLAAILLTFTVWTFMRYYVYNMMITFRLTMGQLLKNAFIFCWVGFLRNLLITVVIVGLPLVLALRIDVFFILLISVYLSFSGFLINFMVNPLIKKYMIDGFDPETGARLEEEKYEGFDEIDQTNEK